MTPAQLERLAFLVEELGEAQQAVGKILRFGYDSEHPDGKHPDNRTMLEDELGHVVYAIGLLGACGDVDAQKLDDASNQKAEAFLRWAKQIHVPKELLRELSETKPRALRELSETKPTNRSVTDRHQIP